MRSLRSLVASAAMLLMASSSAAFTLDWSAIGWDDTDTSGSQTFANVDGSGVSVEVTYTSNAFDRNSVPDLYTPATAPIPEIDGTLRFTNDRGEPLEQTVITLTFSQDVFITDLLTVSLSVIAGLQENMAVQALDAAGAPVFASFYGTGTPGLVALDVDGDSIYRTRGLGEQSAGQYGNAMYRYLETPIRSLSFRIFVTEIGGDALALGWSSQGIGDVGFRAVPEPTTALLLGVGLGFLALTHRRHA